MTEQEFYQELLAELDRAAESDKQLASLLEKIQSGQADFADSAAYWQKFSALIGSVLSQNAVSPGSGLNEEVSYLMLKNGHMRAFEIMSMVQKALDQKQNIHINPINPKFPEERARQAAHSLEDTTVSQEVIQRRAENAIANIANTFHDDYIQENANFRQKAGLKCHVSRIGASKCCAWCAEVAGRYSVGSEPADFWRRHDNCTCKISYENQRVRQQLSGNGKGWAVTSEIQRRRAQAVQYKPTVLTPEQAQTLEQQNLSRFRGLTISGKTDIISIASNAHPRKPELEEMIKKCIEQEKPVFADDLAPNFAKIKPEKNRYIIALHGNPYAAFLYEQKIDARTLANIIQSREDYNGTDEIVLISCNTGNEENTKKCFAQKFANELNVPVHAPTKYGAINIFGKYFSSNALGTKRIGEFKKFIPEKKEEKE